MFTGSKPKISIVVSLTLAFTTTLNKMDMSVDSTSTSGEFGIRNPGGHVKIIVLIGRDKKRRHFFLKWA